MHHPSTSANGPVRRQASRGLMLALLLVLAACGGGGSIAAESTTEPSTTEQSTTEQPTTEPPVEKGQTTTSVDDAESVEAEQPKGTVEGMPVAIDEAPSGDWILVRWQTGQDPEPEGFVAGQAEVRLYDLEPTCNDDGCDLTFHPGGEDDNFALPDLMPLTGEPVAFEAGAEAWTSSEPEESFGCTAELDGPYLDSQAERALAPVRDDEGKIVAMVGPVTFTDTVNDAGKAAGCPAASAITYEYESVMVDSDVLRKGPTFDVNGQFRQTLEVIDSEGYTEDRLKAGGISVGLPESDLVVDGACEEGDCSVDLTVATGKTSDHQMELTSTDGETLATDFTYESGCYDPATGDDVLDEGAYTAEGEFTDLLPIMVVEGEAQIFLGRYQVTSTPTDLGQAEAACSTPEAVSGWVTWIDTDLIDA